MATRLETEAAVYVDRLQNAREQWLGCIAGSPQAAEAMENIDHLLDRINADHLAKFVGKVAIT